jgi:hypothetical protein
MSLVTVTPELRNQFRAALEHPFRFERTERFAMQQVLADTEVDEVFVATARDALARQTGRIRSALGKAA